MSLEEKIETGVKQVLDTNTVGKAREVLQARSGVRVLSLISFFESALPLPILTDPFLIAAIMADRQNAFRLVVATTATSVLGGVCAYFGALFFFETLSSWMSPEVMQQFNELVDTNTSSTFVLTIVGAVTPIPYTIVAWVVAVLKGSPLAFIIASVVGRGGRYAIVGYCVYRFGPLAITYAKRYIGLTSVIVLILAGLFFWLKM
ncbi:hypothetical protein H6781_02435 [Candidatus Nomurabacteria bacterium]|nr:hypothetical protein [Candidatus Nomurabacteria bacterium]MCB9817989.1 hypothetical protein [Candidatus Nomurabacteria bacterium]